MGVLEQGWRDDLDQVQEMIDRKGGWAFMLPCLNAYLENGVTSLKLGMFLEPQKIHMTPKARRQT